MTPLAGADMIGKLIGKSGETIRNLQNLTSTRIQIDHQTQGEFKKVTITGSSAENITSCLKEVERVMSDEPMAGDTSKTLDCPQGIVGRIIGRGGETIRHVQHLASSNYLIHSEEDVVSNPDDLDSILCACHETLMLCHTPCIADGVEFTLACPIEVDQR